MLKVFFRIKCDLDGRYEMSVFQSKSCLSFKKFNEAFRVFLIYYRRSTFSFHKYASDFCRSVCSLRENLFCFFLYVLVSCVLRYERLRQSLNVIKSLPYILFKLMHPFSTYRSFLNTRLPPPPPTHFYFYSIGKASLLI